MQRIRTQLLVGLIQLLIGSTISRAASLDTDPILQDVPPYVIRPQSASSPDILVLNLGNGQFDVAEEFTGALVRPPTAEFDAFHGSERDFQPSFEQSPYRDPYVEEPPSRRPLDVDWSQYRFRTMGNYDLLRDDETGMLLLYSTSRRVVDDDRSVEQLDDFLQTNGAVSGRGSRRKRDLEWKENVEQMQFMPNFLSKYLTLILVRLRRERWIDKVWV